MQQRTSVLVGIAAGTFADVVHISAKVPSYMLSPPVYRDVCGSRNERLETATFAGDIHWTLYSVSKVFVVYR